MEFKLKKFYIIYYKKGNCYETIRLTSRLSLFMYKWILDRGNNDYYIMEEILYDN